MDKAEVVQIVEQFQRKLEAQGIRPMKVILYGSYASNIQRQDSDIDIVIISDDFTGKSYWERIDILAGVIYDLFQPIEAVPLTQAEWASGDSQITRFAREGEVLFAA